ncbi:NudC domain-containing protein 1 [Geranomyces michiganensis]|nr:NudC domain-containing protein 1 [Geranomyces michiganensis]
MPTAIDIALDAALLNPKFESYKLSLSGPFRDPVTHVSLPQPCALVNVPLLASHDSFRKLQARSSFNHLFYSPTTPNCALYINVNYQVVEMSFDPVLRQGVTFKPLWQLATPVLSSTSSSSSSSSSALREYPSVLRAGNYLLASDGAGYVGLLAQQSNDEPSDVAAATLQLPAEHALILLDAQVTSNGQELLFLAYHMEERSVKTSAASHAAIAAVSDDKAKHTKIVPRLAFCLSLFAVNLNYTLGNAPLPVRTVAAVEGFSVPYFAKIELGGSGFVVGAATLYAVPRDQIELETAPAAAPVASSPASSLSLKPHSRNYRWYQTGQDVTVTVRLPAPVERTDIHVAMTPTSIKLRTLRPTEHTLFSARALWESIIPSESIWTLEEEDKSLLTLHLAKRHEDTRWLQLWEVDDGVNETLSADELAAFARALDKYTSPEAVDGGGVDDDSVVELGAATAMDVDPQPRAMQNAMTEPSEEVDFEGSPVMIARFPAAAGAQVTHVARSAGQEWLCNAFSFDASSSSRDGDTFATPAIVLRSDVDALLYTISATSSSSSLSSSSSSPTSATSASPSTPDLSITHTAVFPALGFVQASKRDRRFTAVTRDASLAFVVENRRAFVYEQPGRALQAAQYVLDFGMNEGGGCGGGSENTGSPANGATTGAGDVVGLQQIAEKVVLVLRERGVSVLDWGASGQ